MSGDPTPYLALITSEHASKPNFVAAVTTAIQPFADLLAALQSVPGLYDLDVAAGQQLDVDGQWIGRTRNLAVPLTNVYFSFDTAGLGFDQGAWFAPFDPTTGLVSLADPQYRTLLYAVAIANQWDGTVTGAYNAWAQLFGTLGFSVLIQDAAPMVIYYALLGPVPDAVTLALFTTGELDLKPAGVLIADYVTPTIGSTPFFGFDAENSSISGFDAGAWGLFTPPAVIPT